jgi:hypothetical protein
MMLLRKNDGFSVVVVVVARLEAITTIWKKVVRDVSTMRVSEHVVRLGKLRETKIHTRRAFLVRFCTYIVLGAKGSHDA